MRLKYMISVVEEGGDQLLTKYGEASPSELIDVLYTFKTKALMYEPTALYLHVITYQQIRKDRAPERRQLPLTSLSHPDSSQARPPLPLPLPMINISPSSNCQAFALPSSSLA